MKKVFCVIIALFLLAFATLPLSSAYQVIDYQMTSEHLELYAYKRGAFLVSYRENGCHIEKLYPNACGADLQLNDPIAAVGIFGDTAVLLCNDVNNDQLIVYTYRVDTDILDSFVIPNIRCYGDTGVCYSDNSVFLVSDAHTNIVERYDAVGKKTDSYTFSRYVEQLGVDDSGKVFAVSGNALYQLKGDRFITVSGVSVTTPVNYADRMMADASGRIFEISDSGYRLLFKADSGYGKRYLCRIGNTVYLPEGSQIYGYDIKSGEKVSVITTAHTVTAIYAYNGYVYALSDTGKPSVSKIHPDEFDDIRPEDPDDDLIGHDVNDSRDQRDSISDRLNTGSGSITSSVYRIDTDTYRISGIPAGTTLAQFKKNISFDGFQISFYRDGDLKKSGNCGTAMKAVFDSEQAKYTFELSVIGDITGEGNVNSRDLNLLMDRLIEAADFDGVYVISADLSGDGRVDVKDLALMRRMY